MYIEFMQCGKVAEIHQRNGFPLQAEIKRLQEQNEAASRERQLILQQHEEISRLRNQTQKVDTDQNIFKHILPWFCVNWQHKFTWLWLILDQDKDWREIGPTIRSTHWGWSQCCKYFIWSKNIFGSSFEALWFLKPITFHWHEQGLHVLILFVLVWWTFWCSCRNKIEERYHYLSVKFHKVDTSTWNF